jgi:acyl-CoA synthetase (AMP-forming)/AMP-acid ligase II
MSMLLTLGDLWERNARLYPHAEAVVYQTQRLSYRTVVKNAARLASALNQLGVKPQERVSLLSRNRAEWFDYYAACEIHGYVAATLNFRLTADELSYILKDSTASVLIFEDMYSALVERLRTRAPSVQHFICIGDTPNWATSYEQLLATGDENGPPFKAAATDAVRLIYTSGTTGRPKGVIRSQAADLALARACATTSDMAPGCRELIMMPMFHIGGQSMASGAHWAGGTVVLHRDVVPGDILQSIQDEKVELVHATPTIVQALLDHPDLLHFDLSSLQTVLYAAAPMPIPLLQRGVKLLGNIFTNCYGSTECGAVLILQKRFHQIGPAEGVPERLGSLGHEHQDARVRIVDEAGADCAAGTPGEIIVNSVTMMSGYWNNSAATQAALEHGWFRTGDVGRMDADGFIYLVDRKADMIISGGENIYSREVEAALQTHPDVHQVAVIGVPDDYWGESVKALVVRTADGSVTERDLIAYCKTAIARYKAPKTIEFLEQLPLLPSLKVDKMALRRRYGRLLTS